MNKTVTGLTLASLLMVSAGMAAADEVVCKVLEVEDGDTLVVEIDGIPDRVQLLGIDAPEDTHNPKLAKDLERTSLPVEKLLALGAAATEHLKSLIAPEQHAVLQGDLAARDRYDRVNLVVVAPDGIALNERMVADGYAMVLENPSLDPKWVAHLKSLHEEAVTNAKGLWELSINGAAAWAAPAAE